MIPSVVADPNRNSIAESPSRFACFSLDFGKLFTILDGGRSLIPAGCRRRHCLSTVYGLISICFDLSMLWRESAKSDYREPGCYLIKCSYPM
jgi:hypothetical protein